MNIDPDLLVRRSSLAVLSLVFGLCLYSLLSVLYFRAVFAGLIPVLVFSAGLYFFSKAVQSHGRLGSEFSRAHILLLSLIVLPVVSLIGQAAFNLVALDIDGRSSVSHARNFWVVGSLWLLAGAGMAAAKPRPSNTLATLIVLAIIALLWLGSEGVFVINYGRLSAGASEKFSHLSTSDYAVFCLALAYGLSRGLHRVVVIVFSLFVLFALGGRSALFSFAAAAFLIQVVAGRIRFGTRFFVAFSLVAIFLFFFEYIGHVAQEGLATKDLLFSEGFTGDSSVVARFDQIFLGMADLGRQALFGDPSLIVKRFSSAGAYMHNLLSAWQFYGIAFFLALVVALLYSSKLAYQRRSTLGEPLVAAYTLLLVYVLISVLVAKSITFYLLWLTLGFWLERGAFNESTRS